MEPTGVVPGLVPDLAHHPFERDQGHLILRIAATDVRVGAGEPDLIDLLMRPDRRLVPQDRMEGVARVVDRQRVKPLPDGG